jgi:hypothetical protein
MSTAHKKKHLGQSMCAMVQTWKKGGDHQKKHGNTNNHLFFVYLSPVFVLIGRVQNPQQSQGFCVASKTWHL